MLKIAVLFFVFSQIDSLKLPAEIPGQPGAFVTILAETTGEVVRFFPLDPGLSVFPAELLSNKKATVVVAAGPGRYRVLAYTAIGGKPTEPVTTVVVIAGAPTPIIPPIPKPPGPSPTAALAASLGGIFGGLQEANKSQQVRALAGVYRTGAADLARHQTLGAAYLAMRAQGATQLEAGSISPIRAAIAGDMRARFGDDTATALNGDLKLALAAYLAAVADILEGLLNG